MPRYFFNVHNGDPSPYTQGAELPDDEAAWREATLLAGELFKEIDRKFRPGRQWQLEVTNEEGKPLYLISVSANSRCYTLRKLEGWPDDAFLVQRSGLSFPAGPWQKTGIARWAVLPPPH